MRTYCIVDFADTQTPVKDNELTLPWKPTRSKIWERREPYWKDEGINNMDKDLKGLEEGPNAKIHHNSLSAKLAKYQIGKRQAPIAYRILVLKIHFSLQQTGYRNE